MKHHIGPLIRQIRLARGIGVNELARRAGYDGRGANLGRYERGLKNALRAPECLYPIAEALGTNVPALLLMQEICLAEPELLNNHAALLERLELVNSGIERLASAA